MPKSPEVRKKQDFQNATHSVRKLPLNLRLASVKLSEHDRGIGEILHTSFLGL